MSNIYNSDGTLTSGRVLQGSNFPLTLSGIGGFNVIGSQSMIFQALNYVKVFTGSLDIQSPDITLSNLPTSQLQSGDFLLGLRNNKLVKIDPSSL
jgi:hypothetical protein